MIGNKYFENRNPRFYILAGIVVGLIAAIIIAICNIFMRIQFWEHWIMDAISVFMLAGGLSWVMLLACYSTYHNDPKHLVIRILKSSLCAAIIPGIFMAIVTTIAAWEHNPGGEFQSERYIDWMRLSLIGASWFVFITAFVFLIFSSFSFLATVIRKKFIN
jgi:hypothetical protein